MTDTAARVTGPATEGHHRMPVLLSVNVGMPKNVAWRGKTVYTGAWKHPVNGPATVRRLNIAAVLRQRRSIGHRRSPVSRL
jgi:hypothetical protein